MTSPAIPSYVESFADIPQRLRPVYTLSIVHAGFELNEVGQLLAGYRAAVAQNPEREPIAPPRKLTKAQWATLVAVAEPGPERGHFMRMLACHRIKVVEG